jgi:hypothetical protein
VSHRRWEEWLSCLQTPKTDFFFWKHDPEFNFHVSFFCDLSQKFMKKKVFQEKPLPATVESNPESGAALSTFSKICNRKNPNSLRFFLRRQWPTIIGTSTWRDTTKNSKINIFPIFYGNDGNDLIILVKKDAISMAWMAWMAWMASDKSEIEKVRQDCKSESKLQVQVQKGLPDVRLSVESLSPPFL